MQGAHQSIASPTPWRKHFFPDGSMPYFCKRCFLLCFTRWFILHHSFHEQLSKLSPFNSRLTSTQDLVFVQSSLQPTLPREAHPLGCCTAGDGPPELPPPDTIPHLSLQLRCPASGPTVADWLQWAAVIISTQICCLLPSWDRGHAAAINHQEVQKPKGSDPGTNPSQTCNVGTSTCKGSQHDTSKSGFLKILNTITWWRAIHNDVDSQTEETDPQK